MTTKPTTLLRNFLANLAYNRQQTRRERDEARRRAAVCRETVERGQRAVAETVAEGQQP
jgi:hypothetical protein